jgi:pilus assembly protein Flp/PilA
MLRVHAIAESLRCQVGTGRQASQSAKSAGHFSRKAPPMLQFLVTLQSFVAERKNDDKGATAVEYGLLVALIAAVIVSVVVLLGGKIDTAFSTVNNAL